MTPQTALSRSTLLASRLITPATASPDARTGSGLLDVALGAPGRPATEPTLFISIFDDSGSVISPFGTDPRSNRYAEVAHAISVIARNGARHELGAVLHFDTPSPGDIEPVPLTRRGVRRLRSGLRVPPGSAGSSELAPSLIRAEELALARPDHKATLVVLSDLLLLDPQPGLVLSRLAGFPGQVHAVVLGGPLPAGVLDKPVTVTYIGRDDPPGALTRAIFSRLITHRPGSSVAPGG